MKINFTETGWDDYVYWQKQDPRTLKQINKLITDIVRRGQGGLGRPEPLRGDFYGWWSRHIDAKNRLVYRLDDEAVEIAQCRGPGF